MRRHHENKPAVAGQHRTGDSTTSVTPAQPSLSDAKGTAAAGKSRVTTTHHLADNFLPSKQRKTAE